MCGTPTPNSEVNSKTPEENAQASWTKLVGNTPRQRSHELLGSHWAITYPRGAAKQGQELLTCKLAV